MSEFEQAANSIGGDARGCLSPLPFPGHFIRRRLGELLAE